MTEDANQLVSDLQQGQQENADCGEIVHAVHGCQEEDLEKMSKEDLVKLVRDLQSGILCRPGSASVSARAQSTTMQDDPKPKSKDLKNRVVPKVSLNVSETARSEVRSEVDETLSVAITRKSSWHSMPSVGTWSIPLFERECHSDECRKK